MIIDELIEKWQKEYNALNNNQEEVFIQPYHDFIVDLKRMKKQSDRSKLIDRINQLQQEKDELIAENDKLVNRIKNLGWQNQQLKQKLRVAENNDITLDTDEIEKDVAIRVLAEMVAEK